MKRTHTIASAALMGALTLTPLISFADTHISTNLGARMGTEDGDTSAHVRIDTNGSDMGSTTRADRMQNRDDKKEGSQENRDQKLTDRGDTMIDARISMLQKLETRLQGMKRLTDAEKASFAAALSADIDMLNALKAKIGSDTGTTSIAADLKTIRPDYRIYALAIPQAAITAGADRVLNVVTQMETFGTKLSARITTAQTAGTDVSSAQTAYTDYTAKVADAKVQAQAALDLVTGLKADNGQADVFTANKAALENARTKLKVAVADLKTARADISVIVKVVGGKDDLKGDGSASTTVSH